MCIAEVPVLCQNLPFPAAEVLVGQAPQDRAEVLRLWLVVLLETKRPPCPGVLLPAHMILKPKGEAVFHSVQITCGILCKACEANTKHQITIKTSKAHFEISSKRVVANKIKRYVNSVNNPKPKQQIHMTVVAMAKA